MMTEWVRISLLVVTILTIALASTSSLRPSITSSSVVVVSSSSSSSLSPSASSLKNDDLDALVSSEEQKQEESRRNTKGGGGGGKKALPPSASAMLLSREQAERNRRRIARSLKRVMTDLSLDKLVTPGRINAQQLCTLLLLGFSECRATERELVFYHRRDNTDQNGESNVVAVNDDLVTGKCLKKDPLGFTAALHPDCANSAWWQERKNAALQQSALSLTKNLSSAAPPPQDYIRRSQVITAGKKKHKNTRTAANATASSSSSFYDPARFVPPSRRTYANISGTAKVRDVLGDGFTVDVYPITIGIPKTLIIGGEQGEDRDDDHDDDDGDAALQRVTRHKFFSMAPVAPWWLGGRKNYRRAPSGSSKRTYPLKPTMEYTLAQMYRHSYFGYTMFRGGPDAQRHLEILARGAVPYFPDLGLRCRGVCLSGYPKEMLREALALPGLEHWRTNDFDNEYFARGKVYINLKRAPTINFAKFNHTKYFDLADRLLAYTRRHMTCGAVLAHLLRTAGVESPRSILVLVPEMADYLSMCLEAGCSELGLNYTTNDMMGDDPVWRDHWPSWEKRVSPEDVAERKMGFAEWDATAREHHIYSTYGRGFVWGMRVDPPPNPRVPLKELAPRIRAKEYDFVLYTALFLHAKGRFHTVVSDTLPLLRDVKETLPFERVAFVDGDDRPLIRKVGLNLWGPVLEEMVKGGSKMFVREAQYADVEFDDPLPPTAN